MIHAETTDLVGSVSSNCTGRCVSLHNHRAEQDLIGVHHVPTSQTHQITAAQLAVDRQVEHGHVADVMCIWRWNRMGQISFALSGGFWPTSLPSFQDSRVWSVSMSGSLVVDGSLIVSPSRRRPLSGARLDACSRPGADSTRCQKAPSKQEARPPRASHVPSFPRRRESRATHHSNSG